MAFGLIGKILVILALYAGLVILLEHRCKKSECRGKAWAKALPTKLRRRSGRVA